jgi:hypothetical protein
MGVINGEEFDAMRIEVNQDRVDTAKVRELLGSRVGEVMKTITFYQTKIARKDESKVPKFTPPNLSNYTMAGLIDHLGKVREQIKLLEKEEGIVKAALEARIAKDASARPMSDAASAVSAMDFKSV